MKSLIEKTANPTAITLFAAAKSNGLKDKWLRALAALIVGIILRTGPAAAQQNLVTNPTFATGNTSGWTTQGSCTLTVENSVVYTGSYGCEVSGRTQTYEGIAQSFLGVFQSGQTYNVAAWVQLPSGSASQTMHVTMQQTISGGQPTYTEIASGTVSAGSWTELTGTYTYNPSGTVSTELMYVEMPSSATTSYYIGELSVVSTNNVITGPPTNGESTVDWTNVAQRIDGFGASSAWDGNWTTNQADMFFGTNSGSGTSSGGVKFSFNGIGLSLLRNHITYASTNLASAVPTTAETSIMLWAQERGARVWSTPWTPAAGFKSTSDIYDSGTAGGDGIDGGSYLGGTATNEAYASQLANYVVSMENQGINIYAISVQNEPDADVTSYEACQWSSANISAFVPYLYDALTNAGVGSTKIIIPESQNWTDPKGLASTALGTPSVAADVGIVACHDYVANNEVGDTNPPAGLYPSSGKTSWETEVAQLGGSYDGSIGNALYWAGRIYSYMTVAQASAWHYWWLISENADNEGLTDSTGIPAQRMYAVGQFSRFVRPGYYRIGVDTNSGPTLVSAYKDPNSGNFAIVAINSSSEVVTQVFNFINVSSVSSSVTPWITSATNSLDSLPSVSVGGSSFSYAIPPMSIMTFVGQASSGSPPSPVATTLTLAPSSNPSTYGSPVTFTATVKTNNVAVGNISGETVRFYNGASTLGSGTLNGSGQAAYETTANQLDEGAWSITAVYGGDSSYNASTNSPALSQTVNPATLTYTANATNMVFGAPVPAPLSGTVSGFVGTDTQSSATTGTLTFTTTATSSTPAGNDAIDGSGLTANNGNYNFVQASGNATALTILPLVTPNFSAQGGGITVVANGYQLSFSAQKGQTYKVLATTNLSLPLADWTEVTSGTFGSGPVTVTDSSANTQRFYLIVSP